jgi:Flp pilus assembly protein TadG
MLAMKRIRALREMFGADDGAALAELAFVIPLLMVLLVGIIEVGRFAEYSIRVANAARAGVQYGAQNLTTAGDKAGMESAATNDTQSVTGMTATATTAYCTCADGTASNCLDTTACPSPSHRIVYVRVDTTGTLPSLLNYPGLPDELKTITVKGLAIMRVAE